MGVALQMIISELLFLKLVLHGYLREIALVLSMRCKQLCPKIFLQL